MMNFNNHTNKCVEIPSARLVLILLALCLALLAAMPYPQHVAISPALNVSGYTSLPTGIASYGLGNVLTAAGPYQVVTNEIVGYAYIMSMHAYNASLPSAQNISAYGATMQLNAVMNVTSGGRTYVYWLQNVVDFNTSNSTYYPVDNVWNWTTPTANMTDSVSGYGNVTQSAVVMPSGTYGNQTFYVYSPNATYSYAFPITIAPFMALSRNGAYPMVRMGFVKDGSYTFYDNITMLVPNATAAIIVTPYYQALAQAGAENASYYDAELVFGGETNGTTTNFTQMNADLWLGYGATGGLAPFPYVATFALDTGESATNITTSQGSGYAVVTNGRPEYNSTIALAGVPAYVTGLSAVPLFTSNSTVTTTIYTPPPQQAGQGPDITSLLYAVVLVVAAWVLYRTVRRAPPAISTSR